MKKEELDLLVKILTEHKFSPNILNSIIIHKGKIDNREDIKKVLDVLSDEFSSRGIKDNDEPNHYGLLVDDLITFYSNLLTAS